MLRIVEQKFSVCWYTLVCYSVWQLKLFGAASDLTNTLLKWLSFFLFELNYLTKLVSCIMPFQTFFFLILTAYSATFSIPCPCSCASSELIMRVYHVCLVYNFSLYLQVKNQLFVLQLLLSFHQLLLPPLRLKVLWRHLKLLFVSRIF